MFTSIRVPTPFEIPGKYLLNLIFFLETPEMVLEFETVSWKSKIKSIKPSLNMSKKG